MELKNRSEMDPAYLWDLRHIFSSNEQWEEALARTEAMIPTAEAVRGTLGKSAEALKNGLDAVYAVIEKLEPVYLYAMLAKSGDNGDAQNQDRISRATRLLVRANAAVAFLEPEILSIPAKTLDSYRKDAGLSGYAHILDNIVRGRAHTLDESRETILSKLTEPAEATSNAFEMLTNVDMEFPTIRDDDGNEVRLTNGNFSVYKMSRKRDVRRQAFEQYFGTYKKYINTLAELYGGSVKFDCFGAEVRGYASAREAALFANNVPVSVYDALIEAVHGAFPTMKKYLQLRKRTLGLEKLDLYDLYVPMVADVDYPMPYADAKTLVRNALAPLGEDYQKLLDLAYDGGWIDVYENKGKRSGAFSCGVHGTHPYVLLNYTDTLDDAFTLAHELGHAMHSYLSSQTQDYANHDYRILVAEVASTCNEVLLTMYLLRTETDPKRRAYILNHFLEGFRTTVFRQTLFAEFEMKSHAMQEQGEPLTAHALSELYRNLAQQYYPGADVPELMGAEWSYIPHFYTAFYVYQYATGFCSAVAIADHVLSTGDAAGYRRFLTLGGSDYPLEELKVAGVDLTNPDTVADALRVFDRTVGELDDLLKRISE